MENLLNRTVYFADLSGLEFSDPLALLLERLTDDCENLPATSQAFRVRHEFVGDVYESLQGSDFDRFRTIGEYLEELAEATPADFNWWAHSVHSL